jgi:hypothetical protein
MASKGSPAGFEIAKSLHLPPEALRRITLVASDCWTVGAVLTWPEYNGAGVEIGISYRTLSGVKKVMKTSRRGITLTENWRQVRPNYPLAILEGMSDTAATAHAGFPALGRPSKSLKAAKAAKMLAELIESTEHMDILFVADADDLGPEGNAAQTASLLSSRLPGRVVRWTPTPDGKKDARQWFIERPESEDWAERGRRFLAAVSPADPPAVDGNAVNSPAGVGIAATAEAGRSSGNPPPPADPSPPTTNDGASGGQSPQPHRLVVNANENGADVARQVVAALPHCSNLFSMNDRLYLCQRTSGDDRPKGLIPADVNNLGTLTNDRIRFVTWDSKGRERPVQPPHMPLMHVLKLGAWPGVPVVTRVATSPTITQDGRLLAEPKYDADSGILYIGDPLNLAVPDAPNLPDARHAASALLELVIDFPFQSLTDAATWLALIITAVARSLFDGPTPLFAITANVRGAGKTILVDIAHLFLTGHSVPVSPVPRDQEELRKQVTAKLLDAPPLGLFDNLDAPLSGPVIEALLTSTIWSGRRLGQTETLNLPNSTVWCATGNGLQIDGDNTRRAVWIQLHSSHPNPERRTDYIVPDLMGFVRRHRNRFLVAAITIVVAYLRAGRPGTTLSSMGSYEGWGLIRNILRWLGLPDPAESQAEGGAADAGEEQLRRLIWAIWHLQEPNGILVKDLLGYAKRASEKPAGDDSRPAASALHEAVEQLDAATPRKLGQLLRRLADRQFAVSRNRFVLTQTGTYQNATRWKVEIREPSGKKLADGELPEGLEIDDQSTGPKGSVSLVSFVSPPPPYMAVLREWQLQHGIPAGLQHFLDGDSPNSPNSPDRHQPVAEAEDTRRELVGSKLTSESANSPIDLTGAGNPPGLDEQPHRFVSPAGRDSDVSREFGELDGSLNEANSPANSRTESDAAQSPDLARSDLPHPSDSVDELAWHEVTPGVWEV